MCKCVIKVEKRFSLLKKQKKRVIFYLFDLLCEFDTKYRICRVFFFPFLLVTFSIFSIELNFSTFSHTLPIIVREAGNKRKKITFQLFHIGRVWNVKSNKLLICVQSVSMGLSFKHIFFLSKCTKIPFPRCLSRHNALNL